MTVRQLLLRIERLEARLAEIEMCLNGSSAKNMLDEAIEHMHNTGDPSMIISYLQKINGGIYDTRN